MSGVSGVQHGPAGRAILQKTCRRDKMHEAYDFPQQKRLWRTRAGFRDAVQAAIRGHEPRQRNPRQHDAEEDPRGGGHGRDAR